MEQVSRFWTYSKSKRYVDVLDNLVFNYNNSYHRSIGTAPFQVTRENEHDVYNVLYPDILIDQENCKFKEGDIVRISVHKKLFDKGYKSNWSKEKFRIKGIKHSKPPHYILQALDGEDVLGGFYDWELQKIFS